MAVKTFTTGEVLTASDTNTYLNNGGLVYISGITIGSAVSSVVVSNCFSATYDNYKIVWSTYNNSTTTNFLLSINGSTGAIYFTTGLFCQPGSTTVSGVQVSNATSGYVGFSQGSYASGGTVEIQNPFIAQRAYFQASMMGPGYAAWVNTVVADTSSSTGFTFATSAGTMTGGTIRVYGYRQA